MISRTLNLLSLLDKSSHFLLGPRGVGKSFLIRHQLPPDTITSIDLLDSRNFIKLKSSPHELEAMIRKPMVVIDEIQRIPELLNEVHRLIEKKGFCFLLTGSSARKLRKIGTNLLAGRALNARLFPLTWRELEDESKFNLSHYLLRGGLPKAYLEDIGQDYLFSYVDTYLKEEIQAEALVRNLANYTRFLESAALGSGSIVNYTKIASDAQLSPNTVRDYYQILEDTLLGFSLPCWHKSKKRKAVAAHKFYFFDIGIVHALCNITALSANSDTFGRAFEHFIAQEIRAYLSYFNKRESFCYWRSQQQQEVDFVIGDKILIEVKSAQRVTERDHRGLKFLAEEGQWQRLLVVSQDPQEMRFSSGIEHLPWQEFLTQLWAGNIL